MKRAVVAILLALATPTLAADTARQILDRRKALEDGERHWTDRHQHLSFKILDSRGGTRTRELDVYEKRYPGDERKAIVFFRSPPEVKGTAFLAFNHKGKPAEQWLYLPELQRVRQITANTRNQSFVGTDLTYHDLDLLTDMISWTEDDAASRLRGEESVDGVACHAIELTPKREDIGYAKVVLWLGTSDLVPRKIEFYEDGAEPKKRIVQSEIHTIGKIPVADLTKVESPGAGTSTEIRTGETHFDANLADDGFTQRALEQAP